MNNSYHDLPGVSEVCWSRLVWHDSVITSKTHLSYDGNVTLCGIMIPDKLKTKGGNTCRNCAEIKRREAQSHV